MKTQTFTLEDFKGKATIVKENIGKGAICKLFSYDTHVATYDNLNNKMTVNGYYSATTARHINAFLEFYGFDRCTKQELINFNK